MVRTWVLDTETKGTGAHMVPIERAAKRSSVAEPVYVPRPVAPPEPDEPPPRAPHRFKIVDVVTRQTLVDGASAREAVDALTDVHSMLDANVYVWDDEDARWRLLPLSDQRAMWELSRR